MHSRSNNSLSRRPTSSLRLTSSSRRQIPTNSHKRKQTPSKNSRSSRILTNRQLILHSQCSSSRLHTLSQCSSSQQLTLNLRNSLLRTLSQ